MIVLFGGRLVLFSLERFFDEKVYFILSRESAP